MARRGGRVAVHVSALPRGKKGTKGSSGRKGKAPAKLY